MKSFFSDKGHRKKRETLHIWIRRFRFVVGGVSGPCCSSWLCDSEDDVRLCDCDHLFGFPVKFLSKHEGSTKDGHVISSSKLQTLYKWWKRPDLLASKAVALSPPSDGLLGRWELRTVTKYGTKRFHESVWNDSDIYNWCNVIYCNQFRCNVIQKISWIEALTKPLQFSCHVTLPLPIPHVHGGLVSGFLGRSLARLYELKFVAEEVPEVVGLQKSSELPTWHTVTQFSAQGPATSDAATETAQNLATLTRAAKCWRAQDRNINYCWCNFCLVYLISRGILPLNGLVLGTVDHPSKLRHGSQRFLWCCYSSRGRKNFEVFVSVVFSCVCVSTLSDVLASEDLHECSDHIMLLQSWISL